MNTPKTLSLPLRTERRPIDSSFAIKDATGAVVAYTRGGRSEEEALFLAHAASEYERLTEALKAAEHELTTLHGLYATDKPDAFRDGYSEALGEGLDADSAVSAALEDAREAWWEIDTSKTRAIIRAAMEKTKGANHDV